jgi:hypothetical protein
VCPPSSGLKKKGGGRATWGWLERNDGALGVQVHAVHWVGEIGERGRDSWHSSAHASLTAPLVPSKDVVLDIALMTLYEA